jgi:hypothetical protein
MLLQHISETSLLCKSGSGSAIINHDGRMQVGEYKVEGPGEYDISGIGIHVYTTYAVLFSEGIRVAVFWRGTEDLSKDEESEVDICIPLVSDAKVVTTIIKEQDPRLVVFHDETLAAEVAKQDGITPKHENSFKITTQSLPAEDRQFILLI